MSKQHRNAFNRFRDLKNIFSATLHRPHLLPTGSHHAAVSVSSHRSTWTCCGPELCFVMQHRINLNTQFKVTPVNIVSGAGQVSPPAVTV